jgi:DNA-binding beta-propeller fold protein YncE
MIAKTFFVLFILLAGCIAIKPSERINFAAPDSYPEGIAYDSINNVYYVSSARTGSIGKVTPDGNYITLLTDSNLKSSYGLKIHPDGKRLFACVGDANYSKYTDSATHRKMCRLISVDLGSGKKLADIDLSTLIPGRHFANDLTFDEKGNAYITDSYAHAIYKVDGTGKASVFAKNKLFETAGIGINGIVYHPGGFLLVDNSNTGRLYKVYLNDPAHIQMVKIDQYFLGADGLLLRDDHKLVMAVNGSNDKIFELATEDQWQSAHLSATTLAADRFTYPATIARNGTQFWVMNAKFNELTDSNALPAKYFAIQRAVMKPVPKKATEPRSNK